MVQRQLRSHNGAATTAQPQRRSHNSAATSAQRQRRSDKGAATTSQLYGDQQSVALGALTLDFIVHTKSKNRVFTTVNRPAGKPKGIVVYI
jgi:hypothetical protein